MNMTRKMVVVAILFVTAIGCDQTTKQIARSSLQFALPIELFDGMLKLQYAENPGGMMSFGAELPESVRFMFLTVFVAIMLVSLLIYTLFSKQITPLQTISLTLIVGGGFSNLLDRLRHDGHVIDFLNIGFESVRTGIFNLADVIIILGTLLLLISTSQTPKADQPRGPWHE